MRRHGYGQESVLLELAQNADDALAQAAEINGGALPTADRRLLIQVHDHGERPIVDVTHWGRPINDDGGTAFPAGRDRQWGQDLYFMMLMNLSGKPGEAPGSASSSSSTGRFGLGFKSVHLVSSAPSVVSGFIGFSIAGGLLPQERHNEDDADPQTTEDRRATRIRLPLRQDADASALIERLFRRFAYARMLLPVFARQLREVVVQGGPFPGVHVFEGKPIDGAPGWSVGVETEIPNHAGRWRILRFRPADSGRRDLGTAALAVGLQNGVPRAFHADMPFLWNVVPTSESWGCGYIINGPFKLDPGRTHVSLDDDKTLRTANGIGDALGKSLIALQDVLAEAGASHDPVIGGNGAGFLASLWRVLASGTNTDTLRRSLLARLHGNGRGLGAWMAARPIVPTGLPEPFSPSLPPLDSRTSWEVAADGLGSAKLCAVLAQIDDPDFTALIDSRRIVSAETAPLLHSLRSLGGTEKDCIAPNQLRPSDLFRELSKRWNHWLTPERLHALRPISVSDESGDFVGVARRVATPRIQLAARAADGSPRPLPDLLLRNAPSASDHPEVDVDDELLRSAFAPENHILDPVYVERSEDWRVFRLLRNQHRVDVTLMAKWCADLPKGRRPAALHYLLHGELGPNLLQRLIPAGQRPHWLREYDDVCRLVDGQREKSWRRQSLLAALFPERFHTGAAPKPAAVRVGAFFHKLSQWWDDDTVRHGVIAAYEKRAWPEWLRRDGIADGLATGSVDHWLALLVLGACRSLGRTQEYHHRGFIEWVHREGWWDVLRRPEDVGSWMEVLRDWQDGAVANLTYLRWMSMFPAIYQLSRYQDVYVRLLRSVGRRPEGMSDVTRLLAPRDDQALTGAGTHFDAPPAPLNMGLHWVLRELVRLEIVSGQHLFRHCWMPSEQVLGLLGDLGLGGLDDGTSTAQKADAVFEFLSAKLRTATPNLHRAFDVPLRHVASNAELRQRFGLEK